ncbi:hypothetical protein OVA07_00540 [Novosphingobium sp. SL115]|uniref:hypothetical protein n=1 Tax=Novosphingobium sp. SL115 TaxID=2995150 RepID=UPI0022766251|nr:hypothetical protein [Novosphingobium sp. SL115]MCY1669500.1 hypothetical protein [Novosphingobium sp. SL115]
MQSRLDEQAKADQGCVRLMNAPGVEPIVARTSSSTGGDPRHFARSDDVGGDARLAASMMAKVGMAMFERYDAIWRNAMLAL